MPKVTLEVPETYDNIVRPVVMSVTRDLIDKLALPNDTRIRYQGNAERLIQRGSALDHTDNDPVSFPYDGRVRVDVEESYLEERTLNSAVMGRENNVIFSDPNLMTYMRPIYTASQMVISFRYRAPSKGEALRWRDSIRRRSTQGMQALIHEVDYHYAIPRALLLILEEIHTLRERVAGYDQTLEEWYRDQFTHRRTNLTNLSGTQSLLAIAEKQIGVQGWFDFVAEPENAERTKEGEAWEVGFNYTFQYDKVTGVFMDYPIVIHNQLLSTKFVNTEPVYDLYQQPRRPSFSGHLSELFSPHARRAYPRIEGVTIPHYDDWMPRNNGQFRTIDVITTLNGVDFDNPHKLLNLRDFGEFRLDEGILAFMKRHRKDLTNYLDSVFHLTFYRGDLVQRGDSIVVDEDLNVLSTDPLNPRDVHHFRVSIVYSLSNLTPDAAKVLREDPLTAIKIIDFIEDTFRPILPIGEGGDGGLGIGNYGPGHPGPGGTTTPGGGWIGGHRRPGGWVGGPSVPDGRPRLSDDLKVIGDRLITKPSWDDVIGRLPNTPDTRSVSGGRGLKSVMLAGIIAHKE